VEHYCKKCESFECDCDDEETLRPLTKEEVELLNTIKPLTEREMEEIWKEVVEEESLLEKFRYRLPEDLLEDESTT
jgi:hypothetical protein